MFIISVNSGQIPQEPVIVETDSDNSIQGPQKPVIERPILLEVLKLHKKQ